VHLHWLAGICINTNFSDDDDDAEAREIEERRRRRLHLVKARNVDTIERATTNEKSKIKLRTDLTSARKEETIEDAKQDFSAQNEEWKSLKSRGKGVSTFIVMVDVHFLVST
jgi:hypothetical protein